MYMYMYMHRPSNSDTPSTPTNITRTRLRRRLEPHPGLFPLQRGRGVGHGLQHGRLRAPRFVFVCVMPQPSLGVSGALDGTSQKKTITYKTGALETLAAEVWAAYDRDPLLCRGFFDVTAGQVGRVGCFFFGFFFF